MSIKRLTKACKEISEQMPVSCEFIFLRDQHFNIEPKTGVLYIVLSTISATLDLSTSQTKFTDSYDCIFRIIQKTKFNASKDELTNTIMVIEDVCNNFFFLLQEHDYIAEIKPVRKALDYHRFDDNYSGIAATCTITIYPDADFC